MNRELALEALDQLQSALKLLDTCDAPSQIGASVDLAIHQLREVLGDIPDEEDQIERKAEPQ